MCVGGGGGAGVAGKHIFDFGGTVEEAILGRALIVSG